MIFSKIKLINKKIIMIHMNKNNKFNKKCKIINKTKSGLKNTNRRKQIKSQDNNHKSDNYANG